MKLEMGGKTYNINPNARPLITYSELYELYYMIEILQKKVTMFQNDFAESRITVKKTELLTAIKKNREEHHGLFIKAQEGYRFAVIKELDLMLEDARHGKNIRILVQLTGPTDHTKDYDLVIKMLEMSIADEVTITQSQFAQYVLDDWGWKKEFIGTSARYV